MKKPPFLLGTDEVAFLQAALAEHPYPIEGSNCGGLDCDISLLPDSHRTAFMEAGVPDPEKHDEHLQVVAFTAGMRFQGTPTEDSTIIWMCVRPDCRERITVPKSVWASHPDEVMATLAELVAKHNDSVHLVNSAPSGLIVP